MFCLANFLALTKKRRLRDGKPQKVFALELSKIVSISTLFGDPDVRLFNVSGFT
jgi:hypothetical protein